MTLMVWNIQTVRAFFLIKSLFVADWRQFLKILKVEKSLILRDFRGAKSDIKFEFYEETQNHRKSSICFGISSNRYSKYSYGFRWFACWIRNMRKRRNKRWLVTDMENTIQQLLRFE